VLQGIKLKRRVLGIIKTTYLLWIQ
jgi:hypothetical protein